MHEAREGAQQAGGEGGHEIGTRRVQRFTPRERGREMGEGAGEGEEERKGRKEGRGEKSTGMHRKRGREVSSRALPPPPLPRSLLLSHVLSTIEFTGARVHSNTMLQSQSQATSTSKVHSGTSPTAPAAGGPATPLSSSLSPSWCTYVCICTHIVQPADLIRREVQRGLVMQMRKVQSSTRARTPSDVMRKCKRRRAFTIVPLCNDRYMLE